jgi:hypothetical protein
VLVLSLGKNDWLVHIIHRLFYTDCPWDKANNCPELFQGMAIKLRGRYYNSLKSIIF